MVLTLWKHRALIHHFTVHEIEAKYKGSFGGMIWSFANPLAMLVAYTILFGVFFKLRWPERPDGGLAYFSMAVLAGVIAYNVFADCISRASLMVVNSPQYVKKVVFPIEILPVVEMLVVLFHGLLTMGVLSIGSMVLLGGLPAGAVFAPLLLLPLLLLSLGLSWISASLMVYTRDIKHAIDLMLKLLLHLTPVFFSIQLIPEPYRSWLLFSPLALSVQQFRDLFLLGIAPNLLFTGVALVFGLVICLVGFAFFQVTKKGFSDVI